MDPTDYGNMIDGYSAMGTIATIISLAKDVGVLDILCNSDVALTSQQIADKGQLKERYVREMLGSLVCGKVVQVDSQTSSLFSISPELKPVIKEKCNYTQLVPYCGHKYSAIKSCFKKDGPQGVSYAQYPHVFNILRQDREATQDKYIDRDLLAAHPDLASKLETGIDVLEIGCAHGVSTLNLSQRFPNSRFCGSDVVDSVLEGARKSGSDKGLKNVDFINLDICTSTDYPKNKYDWIFTLDVIHDLPDAIGALSRIFQMLKPGGMFSLTDFGLEGSLSENTGNIGAAFLHGISSFVCVPSSYQGQGSDALGACWGAAKARQIIATAGFTLVKEHTSDWSNLQVTFVCQKPL